MEASLSIGLKKGYPVTKRVEKARPSSAKGVSVFMCICSDGVADHASYQRPHYRG